MTENQMKLILSLVLATACAQTAVQSASQSTIASSPQTAEAVDAPIVAWFDCVECTDDQLKAVVSLGDQAVPELRRVLLNGPPKNRLAQQRKHLEASYRAMEKYEVQNPKARIPLSLEEYVKLYEQKYVMLNRRRSASALGAIGTVLARDALKEAQKQDNLPVRLRREIDLALKSPID